MGERRIIELIKKAKRERNKLIKYLIYYSIISSKTWQMLSTEKRFKLLERI
ncbi:MAG TPA: hypothetical protein PLK41_04530 [Defluviitoga tunisiensis]|nr:hypothetical protein [bacterium]HPP10237.1 hypothetical protein [Defluviitoga tunisiensis]